MRPVATLLLGLLLGLLLTAACAELPLVRRSPDIAGPVPYRLQLRFTSELTDPFTVLAGPMETYNRYPVNAALAELLGRTLERQQDPASPLQAVVEVHIAALVPNYDQFGLLPLPSATRAIAEVVSGPDLQRVTRDGDGDGTDVPEETRRGAVLHGDIRILVDGKLVGRQALKINDQEVINRHDFYPSMSSYTERFDFRPVLERVLLKTSREVSRVVVETLGRNS